VEVGGKWGIIDFEGNELTPIKYDNITAVVKSEKATSDYTSTDLKKVLLVEIDNLKGLIDATGKEITACIYERIYHLENDLAMICQKNKFGVVDMCTGKVLVVPKYHFISQYGKGIYNVELKDKHGYITDIIIHANSYEYNDGEDYVEEINICYKRYESDEEFERRKNWHESMAIRQKENDLKKLKEYIEKYPDIATKYMSELIKK
jgi:hypothetical protein